MGQVAKVDARGRVSLGSEFAGRLVIMDQKEEGVVQITLAEAIPATETWLHKNRDAMAAVMGGLERTAKGEFVQGPDLEADAKLVKKMGG